jgi:hypothetical protein
VEYGEAPPGYRTVRGPERLTSGCYYADIQGSGGLQFVIDDAGGVHAKER